jgi:hypothetical protein
MSRRVVRGVNAALPLPCDSFEVTVTSNPEQVDTAFVDSVEEHDATLHSGHDPPQTTFPLNQGELRQLLRITCEKIERDEVWPIAPEQQVAEVTPTIGIEARDLAIEDCTAAADTIGDLLRQLRPLLEHVAVPRDQCAAIPFHIRETRNPSILGSKTKSSWSNGSGTRSSRMG